MEQDAQEHFPEDEKLPDRPLGCSECKKEIAVRYTEIEGGTVTETCMCNDCPELQKRLKGMAQGGFTGDEAGKAGIACGNCGTTLEAVRVGHPLGCDHCYEVFDDAIVYELFSVGKVPPKLDIETKAKALHVGRSPGEALEVSPSLRLIALNEALKETLQREDYEQAALLRDQINELSEMPEPGDSEETDEK